MYFYNIVLIYESQIPNSYTYILLYYILFVYIYTSREIIYYQKEMFYISFYNIKYTIFNENTARRIPFYQRLLYVSNVFSIKSEDIKYYIIMIYYRSRL